MSSAQALYQQQMRQEQARVQYRGPVTPRIVASDRKCFGVQFKKHELNSDELSPIRQVTRIFRTVPCGTLDAYGNEKNALCWDKSGTEWVAMNTFTDDPSEGAKPVAHCISLRDWWNHPQVQATLEGTLLIKDVEFVDRVGQPITLDQAFELNDKFGAYPAALPYARLSHVALACACRCQLGHDLDGPKAYVWRRPPHARPSRANSTKS